MSLKEILTLGWAKAIWRNNKTLQDVKTKANNAYNAIAPIQQTVSNINGIIQANALDNPLVRALKHSTIEQVTDSDGNINISPIIDSNSVFYSTITRSQINTKIKITINTNASSTTPALGFWYVSVFLYIEDLNSQDFSEGSFFDFGWYHTNASGQIKDKTYGYAFIKGFPAEVDAGMYEFKFMLFEDAPSFGTCTYYGTDAYSQ